MRTILFFAAAAALSLSACGQSNTATTTTVETSGGPATITRAGNGTVTVTGPNGETVRLHDESSPQQAKLPDFLPLYPGAKVTTSFAAPEGATEGGSLTFQTSAPARDVIDFYKQKAMVEGLHETLNANADDTMTYMASKDQIMVQIIASKGKDATDVVLSWAIPHGK